MKAKRVVLAVIVGLTLLISAGAATPTLAWDGGLSHGKGRSHEGLARAPERLESLPHGQGTDEVRRPPDSTP